MIGKTNFRLVIIITTILCIATVVTDWFNILRPGQIISAGKPPQDQTEMERRSTIGKLSMLYGETNSLYERALAAHLPHNKNFGYSMYVLREKTLPGYWSKPAYILDQVLAELALPEEQRLKWLV